MPDLRGNILLFYSTGSWWDRLISFVTHGPYVHVEIALDDEHMIGARLDGIALHPLPLDPDTYVAIDIAPYTTGSNVLHGLLWAMQQRGRKYGWSDVIFQIIKFLNPNNKLRWGVKGRWDCSDFATRYLQQSGVILPEAYSDPYANTPCDLARIFSIIGPRKGRARETVQRLHDGKEGAHA